MGSSKPDTVKAPKMNLAKDIRKYVEGVSQSLPSILSFEQQYRPQFQGLNLGDIQSFLFGANGQPGLSALQGTAAQTAGQSMGQARAADVAQMQGQAGQVRGMLGTLSPESAQQVANANMAAQRAYASAGSLNPQEQRMAQQQAREAYGARGMLNSNGAVAAEVLNREGYLQQKRNEAAVRGGQAYDMTQNFYTAPGLQILGSTPLSYQEGSRQTQLGLGAIGAGTPQLFDIGQALNLGAAQRANIVNAQAANAQAQAGYSAGIMGGIGNLVGSGIGAYAAFR